MEKNEPIINAIYHINYKNLSVNISNIAKRELR